MNSQTPTPSLLLSDDADPVLLTQTLRSLNGKLTAFVERGQVVFAGGAWGSASINVPVSCTKRVLAHFEGYCHANGQGVAPAVAPGETKMQAMARFSALALTAHRRGRKGRAAAIAAGTAVWELMDGGQDWTLWVPGTVWYSGGCLCLFSHIGKRGKRYTVRLRADGTRCLPS